MPAPHRRTAIALFVLMVVVYNANGRESGSTDSQAAKFLTRELVVNHTFTLNATIEAQPLLGERAAFAQDRRGDWRPAYGIVPGLLAAIPGSLLHATGLVDLEASRAPNLIASLTASLLTAGAVVLVFLTLRRAASDRVALLTAIALGVGTNYWAIVAQTLWQHETVAFGTALALWSWWRVDPVSDRRLYLGALGLALAGAARMQVAPMVVVLLAWMILQVGWRRALGPVATIGVVAALEIWRNVTWFGHVLGATTGTESLHPLIHGVPGPLAEAPWWNALGLLISPTQGLFIYSPVVLVAFVALVVVLLRGTATSDLKWLAAAVVIQFVLYSSYSVWWAGHTFGPRYLMDILVPLAPFGAIGAAAVAAHRPARWAATAALIASIGISALGAFVYPHERWNTMPLDVDRHHHRLWDWRDSQISRALRSGPSPQNFNLFNRTSVRRDRA
jgi:hypothetical protein